jgi:hypothetical protein
MRGASAGARRARPCSPATRGPSDTL